MDLSRGGGLRSTHHSICAHLSSHATFETHHCVPPRRSSLAPTDVSFPRYQEPACLTMKHEIDSEYTFTNPTHGHASNCVAAICAWVRFHRQTYWYETPSNAPVWPPHWRLSAGPVMEGLAMTTEDHGSFHSIHNCLLFPPHSRCLWTLSSITNWQQASTPQPPAFQK